MAGTVVTTEETFGSVKKVKFAWTSASGSADATTIKVYNGKILGLTTVPGLSGDQPDDNYSVAVNDEDGVDVLMSGGASRDETNTEHVLSSSLGCVANDTLTLAVTSAGDAKTGVAYVWIR